MSTDYDNFLEDTNYPNVPTVKGTEPMTDNNKLPNGKMDWPEDYKGNGCYTNSCVYCRKLFHGKLRRKVCKVCDTERNEALEKINTEAERQMTDNNKPVGDGRPKPCANIYKNGRLKTKKEMSEDGTAPPVDILFCPKCKNKMEFIDTDYVCHNCKLAWELPLYTREQALSLAIDEIEACEDLEILATRTDEGECDLWLTAEEVMEKLK